MSADLLFHWFIGLIIGPREIKRGYTLLVASIWLMNESWGPPWFNAKQVISFLAQSYLRRLISHLI